MQLVRFNVRFHLTTIGKTSLAKKISQRGFTSQHQPTIGIDFVVCTLVLNTKETGRFTLNVDRVT